MNNLARAMVTVTVALLALSPVTGCAKDEHPRIPQYPPEGDGWAAMSLPHRRADQPTIFDAINLCIDRPGSVEIVDVTMERAEGGFVVQGFATRPMVPPNGTPYPQPVTFNESLWELGYQPGNKTIDTVCVEPSENTPAEHRTQVGVQFSKLTDKTARGALLRITYRSGDKTYAHRMGFEAVLCETEASNPECEAWDYDWTDEPVKIVRSTNP